MRVWISRSPKPFLILVILGVSLGWIWWNENRQVQRSHSFLPTTAIITSVYYSPDDDSEDESRDEFYYTGKIEQSGVTFRSSRISYGNVNSDKTYYDFVEEHPAGTTLEVFYAPDNPSEIIVHPGELSSVFQVILGAGVTLFGAGLLGLVQALLYRRRPLPNKVVDGQPPSR